MAHSKRHKGGKKGKKSSKEDYHKLIVKSYKRLHAVVKKHNPKELL